MRKRTELLTWATTFAAWTLVGVLMLQDMFVSAAVASVLFGTGGLVLISLPERIHDGNGMAANGTILGGGENPSRF